MTASLRPAAAGTQRLATCPRTSARRIPAGSPQWVLLHLVRDALSPAWTPAVAAERLLDHVESREAMRLARIRLQQVGANRATLVQARALATLNLAINRFEDSHPTPAA